jgi:rifampicin phosphotransferase
VAGSGVFHRTLAHNDSLTSPPGQLARVAEEKVIVGATSGPEAGRPPPQTVHPLTVPLAEVEPGAVRLVGGKGANLGRMVQAGLPVPDGFCVTTAAYALATAGERFERLLVEFDSVQPQDVERLEALAAQARQAVLEAPIPAAVEAAVGRAYAELVPAGGELAVAVRSSATAEDLGEASFAGQQDTYLNVVGVSAVLDAVRHCWASLWTDRAVAYRAVNRVDQRQVLLSAVVQQMVPAAVSGVLFTANPMSGRRGEGVLDAVPGLGEALVSGRVNPDHFVVDRATRTIRERRVGEKQIEVRALPGGGTEVVGTSGSASACVEDDEVLQVVELGARVEAQFGGPQDIEWALDQGRRLWLLQTRPITTLFPVPKPPPANGLRVYFNMSNAQGVLQPLTPMGIEIFRRIGTGVAGLLGFEVDPERGPAPLVALAGRLFFDITALLRAAPGRRVVLAVLGVMEPRSADSIREVLLDSRIDPPRPVPRWRLVRRVLGLMRRTGAPTRMLIAFVSPERARRRVAAEAEAFLASTAGPVEGPEQALEKVGWLAAQTPGQVFGRIVPPAAAGIFSLALARRVARRARVEDDAMTITRGLPHNVTTEMNLELWAVAQRLRQAGFAELLEESPASELAASYLANRLPDEVQQQVAAFLRVYGFRGVAEIDVGVARWEDDPTHIFGVLSNFMRLREPELAPDVQFRRAEEAAAEAIRRALEQARRSGFAGLPRAVLLRALFGRVRALGGLRESPKFYAVAILGTCRRLLLSVGRHLAQASRIQEAEDIFFLTLAEAREALSGKDQRQLVLARRAEYEREFRRRRQPRVLLSDGTGFYGGVAAAAAGDTDTLAGSAASPGTYTGPARVVLDPAGARLEPGEVLVAPSTDPGWTPLFMTAGGLVMEMGGMMSHGSIVAREYGIPAVVGVPGATTAIRTGQVVTVDGDKGLVRLAGHGTPA